VQDKNKWFLVLIVSAVVLGVAMIGFISRGGNDENAPQKNRVTIRSSVPSMQQSKIREKLEDAKAYEPPDPAQKVQEIIESHRLRIEEDPDNPETPVLLEAMGNLYSMRLGDHEMAAYYYEQLLQRYPEINKTSAYVGLVTSFEKMGDLEGVTRICNEMMKEYPKDSVEYKWAADKTGVERREGPAVIHPGSPEEAERIKQRRAAMEAARNLAMEEIAKNEGEQTSEPDTAGVEEEAGS
jgi:tetratricopeptide (TPR) repeat protein